jgi:polygalacturonase
MQLTPHQQITFKNGLCSGGHGLSIGSVGGRSDNTVDTVAFSNSQVTKSTNGIRVKASVGTTGKINKVTYTGITLSSISKYVFPYSFPSSYTIQY